MQKNIATMEPMETGNMKYGVFRVAPNQKGYPFGLLVLQGLAVFWSLQLEIFGKNCSGVVTGEPNLGFNKVETLVKW
ncbi:hypothetical protein ACK6D9_00675 [Hoeflea sp. Naph1]|uniref:hypothetical protein n=1 Tax=Hoeflea sp. Naph1 TaxID=3388653 RepID=UPI00398FB6F6